MEPHRSWVSSLGSSISRALAGRAASRRAPDVEQSIPARFERVAARRGAHVALGAGSWESSYAELNAAANRLAHRLLSLGGAAEDRVALLLRHDGPLVGASLGVLKAGRVVTVLNPTEPPARLRQVLELAEPAAIVTDASNRELAERVAPRSLRVVSIEECADAPTRDPGLAIAPDRMAWLLFTSGSTGRPKGVVQTHRGILHNVHRLSSGMGLRAEDRVVLLGSPSGGQGLSTIWCALLAGARLCPFPAAERGVTGLADWMVERGITVFIAAASLFRHFARTLGPEQRFPAVRVVRLASEVATAADFAAFQRHFSDGCLLLNTLSSSETGNIAQHRLHRRDFVSDDRLPSGRPAPGIEIRIVGEDLGDVPPGAVGEIMVGSRYLSAGYWRDDALTASRFSEGPGGMRFFRTGDLARRGPDGALIFAGRRDAQVKVRGYRVELSEVEDALARLSDVERAAVCARRGPDGDARLVAFLVLRAGRARDGEAIRRALRAAVPSHMVPATFVVLDELPLNAHGKIDRERLRALDLGPAALEHTPEEPATESEALLAGLWSDLFGRDAVGPEEDFFALGGDSLGAAVIAARVHAAVGVELDLPLFSEHPTLRELAAAVDRLLAAGETGSAPRIQIAPRDRPLPLSFEQERTWSHCRSAEGSAGYTMACSYGITGPLDVGLLRESMDFLARRHEILRTTFEEVAGQPAQVVHPAEPLVLPLVDLAGAADAEETAGRILRDEARRPFDLAKGPLVRASLLRIRDGEYWLVRVFHHIVSDALSFRLYLRELAQLYDARQRGEPPPLAERAPLQYGDYAAWQRSTFAPGGALHGEAVAWWEKQLAGAAAPSLPFARPRPAAAEASEGILRWGPDAPTTRALDRLARREGLTYFAIRLGAFAALLAAEAGTPDVVLGTYATHRSRVETQSMLGFFVNLVTLRLRFDPSLALRDWLSAVRRAVGEAQAHAHLPYESLCAELRARGKVPPEVRAIFAVADQSAPVRFGGCELRWLERRFEAMPWGFTLAFDRFDEERRSRVLFDASLYEPAGVRRFTERYIRLLGAMASRPDERLGALLAA